MKAVFLDRDGVINEGREYVHRVEDFRLLPGVVDGLRLQQHGWKFVVVINQAGIARGLYGESEYQRLSTQMRTLLADDGVLLDAIYHCPHHPSAGVAYITIDPIWTCDSGSHFFHYVPAPWQHLVSAPSEFKDLMRAAGATDSELAKYPDGMNRCRLEDFRAALSSAMRTTPAEVIHEDSYSSQSKEDHADHRTSRWRSV